MIYRLRWLRLRLIYRFAVTRCGSPHHTRCLCHHRLLVTTRYVAVTHVLVGCGFALPRYVGYGCHLCLLPFAHTVTTFVALFTFIRWLPRLPVGFWIFTLQFVCSWLLLRCLRFTGCHAHGCVDLVGGWLPHVLQLVGFTLR